MTGGLLVLSLDQPNNCINAENLCVADPACSTAYHTLQNCSQSLAKSSFLLLDQETKSRCLEAETNVKKRYFQRCKCHRRPRKQEEQCLRIYWTVRSTLTHADFNLEMSPYEDMADEESSKTNYNKLATKIAGLHIASTNPCLHATNVCHLDHKCMRLRSLYAQICSIGFPCDRHKCHQRLRHFFERISVDFTKRLLFCPCQDELCGKRRWNTIVPECSFQSSIKPNCLFLLELCLKDNICRSRLADFQERCNPSGTSSDGCSRQKHAACLEAYMGMIGTPMTPNYISNSSNEVSLWCSCKDSGNQKEDCDQILDAFASSACLKSAIQSQMNSNQMNMESWEQLQFTPSLNIQGDGTSTVFTAKMYWQPGEKKVQPEVLMHNSQKSFCNSLYSGAQISSLTLTLTLFLLLLGPP
ncbi:GDNF family receptor alpha-3 isoform X2 [Rhineura floridana]|uniref:GDNF family receptor alpha-3 isoform X2 n=1 Tax=Rhineura floridana TaxID=261503 RepID=UPI002AC88F3C|nr:GDNF family receptor alpha-3 isoform X2 [Rhineura floridana]XP_061473658.1 GDNF family receptor alpha-3 isoform X2 [Rhineura floridana]